MCTITVVRGRGVIPIEKDIGIGNRDALFHIMMGEEIIHALGIFQVFLATGKFEKSQAHVISKRGKPKI